MRFIDFKKLEGRNFLSIGNNTISVCLRPGVNAIVGTNCDKEDSKNGAGKSTVTELLYYALYGTTLREISKDFIQNSITKERCEVSLEFNINSNKSVDTYKITRKLNPTKCALLKNGEDITRSTLAKTNQLIQDLIRTPAAVFRNSVIMSANNALPFMALSKTDKRKFVESVLGLEIFTQMVLKARDDHSVAKKDYEIAYSKLEQTQSELAFNQSQLDNYENVKQERLRKLSEKSRTLVSDIKKIKEKITSIELSAEEQSLENVKIINENITKLTEKSFNLQAKHNTIQAEINSIKRQITQLQTNKNACPTCSREYSDEHVEHVSSLITKHNQDIEKYLSAEKSVLESLEQTNKETAKLQTLKLKQEEKLKHIAQLANDNKSHKLSIDHLETNLMEVNEEINLTKKEQNNELKGKVSFLKSSSEDLQRTVDKLNNELNILESVKFVISEEGIKSFIVKKIIKVLNSRLAYYLKKLEANCLCKFNEFFDEEIVDENLTQKSYFNFSGGERKRIDLACLFAFADIRRLQGDVNFSTVFYDELLDSSLDDRGVQLTLRTLRERFNEIKESCYIITHRGPEVTAKAEHTIHVVKKNGITELSC